VSGAAEGEGEGYRNPDTTDRGVVQVELGGNTVSDGRGVSLPVTGAGVATVGTLHLTSLYLVGIAVGIVAIGAVLVRLGWRRGKTVDAR
jgi:hypothetical protein